MDLSIWKQAGNFIGKAIDPALKVAQIGAIGIAGFWTYHIHEITGEQDLDPEVSVSTQSFPYSKGTRLLVVHIREKNAGKVPVEIDTDALTLTVKQVPESLGIGYLDMDRQPALFKKTDLLGRLDEGIYLSPGAEGEDVAEFVVAPGVYTVEANISLKDGDFISHVALQTVE